MNWQKLSSIDPEIEKIKWLRPERKNARASIALVGGSNSGFMRVQQIFSNLLEESLKELTLFLPDVLQKKLPSLIQVQFVDSTVSGSISQQGWDQIKAFTKNKTLIIANDISSNSETTLGAVKLLQQQSDLVTILDEQLSYLIEPEANPTVAFFNLKDVQLLTSRFSLPITLTNASSLEKIREVISKLAVHFDMTISYSNGATVIVDPKSGFIVERPPQLHSAAVLVGERIASPAISVAASSFKK